MKKVFFYLGAAILSASCSSTPSATTINGHLEGMEAADSVVIFYNGQRDTIAAPNGEFTYEYTDSVANIVRVLHYDKGPDAPRVQPITVMMFPGVSVDVEGNFSDNEVSGGDFYDEYNTMYKEIKDVDAERKAVNARYMDLVNAKAAREDIMRCFEELKVVDGKYQAHLEHYIAGHLNSEVSLFLLCNVHPKYGEKYIFDFTDAVKNGAMKEMYASTLTYYEKSIARRQAQENIQAGKLAPDFTAKDVNGNDFTLSSLRGKWVVLDFWGSWCGWCIAGFPDMKHMYEKYKDRVEFVSISCRDKEDRWKAAVAKHELKWTNVLNPSNEDFKRDLSTIYNIGGYPTKIIISPEGKIMEIYVGETPEFYNSLRFLMMK